MMEKLVPKLRFREFKDTWRKEILEKLSDVSSGGTPSRAKLEYWNGEIPWVSTSLIDFNTIEKTEESITELGLKNSSAKLFPVGTILMAMYGQGKTRGKVALLGVKSSTNQACGAIIPNETKLNNIYLFQNLAHRYDEIRDLSNQGGQENLSGGIIKLLKITFPTLPEQQKIATFLTTVDEKINLLKTQKSELERYKKGVMQKIFSQELRFKDGDGKEFADWESKELIEIGEIVTGKTPSTKDLDLWYGDVQFVTPTDINEEKYQYRTHRTIKELAKTKLLPEKSIMFTCIASIGKMSLSVKPCVTNQQINSIIPFENFDNEFIYYSILNIVDFIKSTQSTNTLPIINKTEFSKFRIIVPREKKEQTKIANFLSALDEKIALNGEQITKMEVWKKGLLQQMFV